MGVPSPVHQIRVLKYPMKIGLHQMATRNSSSGYGWQMKLREKHTLSNIPNGEWRALIWRRCQICEIGQENSKINHLNKPPSSITSLFISNFRMGWNYKLNKNKETSVWQHYNKIIKINQHAKQNFEKCNISFFAKVFILLKSLSKGKFHEISPSTCKLLRKSKWEKY